MVLLTRYRVPDADVGAFRDAAAAATGALDGTPGWTGGELARSVDDHRLWSLTARFSHAGTLRRALGAMPARLALMALQRWAVDEPSVFETLGPDDPVDLAVDALR